MPMIVDTHCHLDMLTPLSLHAEIDSARRYLTMSTGVQNWHTVSNLCGTHANVFAALGIHPWFVASQPADAISSLQRLLDQNRPTALGEIGLDFSSAHIAQRHEQLRVFEAQLVLAKEYALPVSLHVIKAHAQMLALLKRYRPAGVVHSLGASTELAQQYIDLGLKIGVNSLVVRDNARRYHQLVTHFGVEAIVLESDAPNIVLPGAKSGHLYDIDATIARIAQLSGMHNDDVISLTEHNAQQIFHFS
ncbi:MAG: TatD family hydrolase [Gammaproteobacteria bacterium]|nr:TatD family hydrolase [Gammaproteobacteria bacterium]